MIQWDNHSILFPRFLLPDAWFGHTYLYVENYVRLRIHFRTQFSVIGSQQSLLIIQYYYADEIHDRR